MNIMEKSKIYFTIGIVGVQCGAVAIHWGLGLIFLGALFLLFSYIKFEEHQEDDDESNILELPSEAPHGAIWPWNGKQYIRIDNTWVQLEEYSINNNYKNKELCTDTHSTLATC